MQLKNMFERDIQRKIKGVIVVGEDQKIKEELDARNAIAVETINE